MRDLYVDAAPCPGGDPLTRNGDPLNHLSVGEARRLAERLLAAARESECAEITQARQMPQRDPDNDHRFEMAGTDGYEL